MRCSQPMGLSKGGEAFLQRFEQPVLKKGVIIFPNGTEKPFEEHETYSSLKQEESGETCGMFSELPLMKYTAPDGRVFYEYVQEAICDSGPMEFYALKDENGKPIPETLWTKDEMEEAGDIELYDPNEDFSDNDEDDDDDVEDNNYEW